MFIKELLKNYNLILKNIIINITLFLKRKKKIRKFYKIYQKTGNAHTKA